MSYSAVELRTIHDRTAGRCHLCGKRLAIGNYFKLGERGAWEVDHSVPRQKGGTDHGNNLVPACISCNRSKRDGSTRTARRRNGLAAKPLSVRQRDAARNRNAAILATAGGVLGLVGGVPGVIAGSALGGWLGHSIDPEL